MYSGGTRVTWTSEKRVQKLRDASGDRCLRSSGDRCLLTTDVSDQDSKQRMAESQTIAKQGLTLSGYKFQRNTPNVTLSLPFDTTENARFILIPLPHRLRSGKTNWMYHRTYATMDERIVDASNTLSYKSPKFKIMTSSLEIQMRIDSNDVSRTISAITSNIPGNIVSYNDTAETVEITIDCAPPGDIKDILSKTFDEKFLAQCTFHQHKDEILQMEEIFDSKVAVLKKWLEDIRP